MIGQPEVVVRADVEHGLAARHADAGLLRRGQHALAFEQAGRADLGQLVAEMLLQTLVSHEFSPPSK